jgi:putative FmdB family regulatory protein
MPMFEYQCRTCAHEFETLVLSGRNAPRCPKCESQDLQKRFSVFGTASGAGRSGGGFSVPMGGG